ncbi:pectate lyase superfamily protein-domain-containing protein [Mycena alexandri]|uniref:Pectate lyase superfamily protein-domain-containing protein n=1 Tax=Mycena alexandri TaxID=1745969 RepID=A0AAD6WQB8_9AGAR|nr:pectate lyase superfamily protein-domain-containing protein [Mycena alexandri]
MGTGTLHANGTSAFNPTKGYKVFRNVMTDFGAVGNGVHDDTDNINMAINATGRCGFGCNSSTIAPAVIYFPPGKYRITKPIVPFYFTSLVGDFNSKPQLIADPLFNGIAVIDADPYVPGEAGPDGNGVNWWLNQNNFFRSVRNFVIDVRQMPPTAFGTGIHWQVGQATSIINVDFLMSAVSGTKHQGIFAENGSGGFMSDLTFTGGAFGLWISNQQFTIRNVQITNAVSAIYQEWNWGFTWQNIKITNCAVGFDLHTGGLTLPTQSAGGVLILDSTIQSTGIGVRMDTAQTNSLAGSIILDNVVFSGITGANIQDPSGTLLAANVSPVRQWFQGNTYSGTGIRTYNRGTFGTPPTKASALLDSTKKIFAKSRPQYNTYTAAQFISVKSVGKAAGNGIQDDTAEINAFITNAERRMWNPSSMPEHIGSLIQSSSRPVPQIVGDMYSTILGSGAAFNDQTKLTPVLKVGNPGDSGIVEISDIVISTVGGSQGAVGIEWNVKGVNQGDAGMWDVHVRLGGAIGTNVNLTSCPTTSTDLTKCATASIGFHITPTGSGYFENVWVWSADHDLDAPSQGRINAFSARGILSESSAGPVWLVGTASEHHVLYQYSFLNSQNIYAGLIQTETPYFQPTPNPPAPFSINTALGDPAVSQDAWGLVITNSFNVFIYGAGLYSFFQTYGQACVTTQNCQTNMALIDSKSAAVYIYQLTTTGSVNMLTQAPSTVLIKGADDIDGYASTATFWGSSSATVLPPVSPPPTGPPQTKCTLVQAWVSNWVEYTSNQYWVPFVPPAEPGGSSPPPTGGLEVPQAWEEPVLWEAIISWLLANNIKPDADSDATFILGESEFITVDPGTGSPTFGGGNDDILWAALAWMRYYEYVLNTSGSKPASDILSAAQNFIDEVGGNRNLDPCPGGVFWKQDTSKGKNTITNALFIHASAKYYLLTGVTSYRDQAVDVWNWVMDNGIQRSDHLYNDGTSSCGSSAGEVWTYNQGEMIAAAGSLALALKNSTYISLGNATAYAAITNGTFLLHNGILTETGLANCDLNSTCDDDQARHSLPHSFKGIFMRGLEYFLDAANDAALTSIYAPWIGYQVRAITDNAQASSGDVGNVWSAKITQVFGGEVIGMAINAGNAAAKYGTSNGTFTC